MSVFLPDSTLLTLFRIVARAQNFQERFEFTRIRLLSADLVALRHELF